MSKRKLVKLERPAPSKPKPKPPAPKWSIRAYSRDPELEQILAAISDLTPMQIERKCGVTAQTIRNWRSGKTRRPQNLTLQFSLRAAGLKRVIVPRG
jgi:transcriptional regulator with XRE-family HTH domain